MCVLPAHSIVTFIHDPLSIYPSALLSNWYHNYAFAITRAYALVRVASFTLFLISDVPYLFIPSPYSHWYIRLTFMHHLFIPLLVGSHLFIVLYFIIPAST